MSESGSPKPNEQPQAISSEAALLASVAPIRELWRPKQKARRVASEVRRATAYNGDLVKRSDAMSPPNVTCYQSDFRDGQRQRAARGSLHRPLHDDGLGFQLLGARRDYRRLPENVWHLPPELRRGEMEPDLQTFNYGSDNFGNVNWSGSSGMTLGYDPTTNHFSNTNNPKPTYDQNGNLTYDVAHNYTWDADGNLSQLDSAAAIV